MSGIIQHSTKDNANVLIEAFGKIEQVKKMFWTLFISMAGLVLDPVTAQQIVGLITGMGG